MNISELKTLASIHKNIFKAGENIIGLIPIDRTSNQQILTSLLMIRFREHYLSIRILVENGMANDALIILRSLTEVYLRIENINKDPSFADDLIKSASLEKRKKYIVMIEKNDLFPQNKITIDQVRLKLKNIDEYIKKHNPKKISIEELAKRINRPDLYDIVFRYTSDVAHIDIAHLEKAAEFDAHKSFIRFDSEKEKENESNIALSCAISSYICAVRAFSQIFNIKKISEEWNLLIEQFNKTQLL